VERSRIIKVAGWSFVGFCAASVLANKLPLGINTVQIAGFCGAFTGALIGRYRRPRRGDAGVSGVDREVQPEQIQSEQVEDETRGPEEVDRSA
jgi:hypothetical protein